MDRKQFEKAYEPNPQKSPFTEVKFDEVAQVYKPLDQFNPRIASSLNAAWYGWRIRQAEVDQQQAKVDKAEAHTLSVLETAEQLTQQVKELIREKAELQKQKSLQELEVNQIAQANQVWQSKCQELQKRLDKALQEIKGAARWIDEDAIDDPDFIKGGALRALRRLEQALKGEG